MSFPLWCFSKSYQTGGSLLVNPIIRRHGFTPDAAFAYLGLSSTSSPEECREAYLKLARQEHPDARRADDMSLESESKSDGADCTPFQRLQTAYRIAYEASKNRTEQPSCTTAMDPSEPMIRHRAPQHRHFLESESRLGSSGTTSAGLCYADRYKQIQVQRFAEAAYASADYRVNRLCSEITPENSLTTPHHKNVIQQRKFKALNFIEHVAEELIQEAMERGDFNHLPGEGKPLPKESHMDLFGDPATAKISRILVNQGYLPNWVQLGKELRERWEKAVAKVSRFRVSQSTEVSSSKRAAAIKEFREEVIRINKLIDRYNLMVPALHLQRGHKDPNIIIQDLLSVSKSASDDERNSSEVPLPSDKSSTPSSKEQRNKVSSEANGEESSGNLFDARYLAEIIRDFYRELARAYVSMMRGFKNHK